MKFDLIYLLNVIMLVIFSISLGYTVLRYLKSNFRYKYKTKERLHRIKALKYKIYLDIKDYVTFEKYEIWRFCIPV